MPAIASVNSIIRLVVKTDRNDMVRYLNTQKGPTAWYLRKIESMFGGMAIGAANCNVLCTTVCVAATGTVTLASMVATDTVTINGTVFTCVASGATGNQFNVGGNDTITATNLAAAINASATGLVGKTVIAKSAAAVVTITCAIPGFIGNLCSLAISAHGSVSGALLTGGSEGVTSTYSHGL